MTRSCEAETSPAQEALGLHGSQVARFEQALRICGLEDEKLVIQLDADLPDDGKPWCLRTEFLLHVIARRRDSYPILSIFGTTRVQDPQ
jgi:hypothetical protein